MSQNPKAHDGVRTKRAKVAHARTRAPSVPDLKRALNASDAPFRNIIDKSAAGMVVVRTAGTISAGSSGAARRRIVVVEDNTDNRQMLHSLLELSGHQVTAAADGRTGLEAIRAILPEIALVDIGLPLMDGHEVARRIRALPECDQVLLVALTGYGRPEDRKRALEAGFDAHLVKPVDFDELADFLAFGPRGVRPAPDARFMPSA